VQGLDGNTIRKLVPAAGQLAREPLAHRLIRASKGRYTEVESPTIVVGWILLPVLMSVAGGAMYVVGISGSALVFMGAWNIGIIIWIADMVVIDLKI